MNIQEVSESPVALPSGPPISCLQWEKRENETFGRFPYQPEKALEAYDEAYRKNPHDASLVSRIGQAYVKTHQYTKVRLGWGGERCGPAQQGRGRGVHEWKFLDGKGVAAFPP